MGRKKYPPVVVTGYYEDNGEPIDLSTPEKRHEFGLRISIRAAYAIGGKPKENSPYKDYKL
jgi:hypothetical protein